MYLKGSTGSQSFGLNVLTHEFGIVMVLGLCSLRASAQTPEVLANVIVQSSEAEERNSKQMAQEMM